MAKAPKLTKTVSQANLERLESAKLAALLVEASAADPGLRRRLRLELAAEIGVADLALELDKRMQTLATSRSRVSWRKRPELIRELDGLRRLIVERLAAKDPALALPRLMAWFDLAVPLATRVKDPKGELEFAFDAATPDLGRLASTAGAPTAAPVLIEAVETRANPWAAFVGRAAGHMKPALAKALLAGLGGAAAPTGRRALAVRRLADRCGDLDAWLASFSEEDRRRPEVGAETARRLAEAGRAGPARAALDAALPVPAKRGWRGVEPEPPSEAWRAAEIAVLEAEGRTEAATEARWSQFERTLSPEGLKAIVATLGDFEDVVAVDRAIGFAAGYFDLMKGLDFLMAWGALREAAEAIDRRADELRGGVEDVPLWASRLSGRHPAAAVRLLRARATALAQLGAAGSEESERVIAEAEALAGGLADVEGLASHDAFLRGIPRGPMPVSLRRRR